MTEPLYRWQVSYNLGKPSIDIPEEDYAELLEALLQYVDVLESEEAIPSR